jgi:amidase
VVEIGAPPSAPPGAGGDRGYEGWARWIEAHPESPYKEAAEIISSPKRLPYSRRAPYTGTGRMTQTQIDGTLAQRAEYKRRLAGWMDTHGIDAVAFAGLLSDVALNDGQTPSFGRVDPQSSASGVPSVIFPAGRNDHGEPINLQFQGKAWDDAKLLGMAYAFDRVAKGHVLPDTAPKLKYEPSVTPAPIVIEQPFEPETVAPKPDADTNTGAAPAPSAPAPAVVPRLTVTLTSAAAVRGGRARLVLRNTGTSAISGRVTLTAKVRGHTVTFGRATVNLPAGAKRTITVKLGPTAKRALKGRTRYSATATVSAASGTVLSKRVSLRTA